MSKLKKPHSPTLPPADQKGPSGFRMAWDILGSIELTIAVLVIMMVLVLFGTLNQVQLGTWLAQKKYFSSWFIFFEGAGGVRFPIFPGGYTVGGLWLVNLLASHTTRARWEWRRAGLVLTHVGLFVLLAGQGLTQMLAKESQLIIEEGQTRNYSEDFQDAELAIIDTSASEEDVVHTIPAALLADQDLIQHPGLPFVIQVKQFFPNAVLGRGRPLATMGVGATVGVTEAPVVTADDQTNNVSAHIQIKSGENSHGVWLVSTGLGAPQTFVHEGKTYRLLMRPKRYNYPFQLTLLDFTHDRYPGTDIPKNFASRLRLVDPKTDEDPVADDRDVLIYMNHPLRYRGLTFYQQSYGKNDTLSVLQVVKNPVWVTPYLACILVSLGLTWQFGASLIQFLRRPR